MKDTIEQLNIIKRLMVTDDYPVVAPVAPDTLAELLRKAPPAVWDAIKKSVYLDIQRLLNKQPGYTLLFEHMDGLEYNGLTLYNLVQAEDGVPVWSNIYIRNIEVRDNDIYVDPNLTDKVILGEDGMSIFAYSFVDNDFQIRDKASTDYVIESHPKFSAFLSALISTVN